MVEGTVERGSANRVSCWLTLIGDQEWREEPPLKGGDILAWSNGQQEYADIKGFFKKPQLSIGTGREVLVIEMVVGGHIEGSAWG